MLERLYVNNFRTFQNFELRPAALHSALFCGKNGTGKTALGGVFALFQQIGAGKSRVGELVKPDDFWLRQTNLPMRFELEVRLDGRLFAYTLVLELPERFRELRVLEESLTVDGTSIYRRRQGAVEVVKGTGPVTFTIDWHFVALPLIQVADANDFETWKTWLQRMLVLAPVPALMSGVSLGEASSLELNARNFSGWLTGLLAQEPSAIATILGALQQMMPDLSTLRNLPGGRDSKSLFVVFKDDNASFEVSFDALSNGEKCMFLASAIVAANENAGPFFVFWDEIDNHVSLDEIDFFVRLLRRGFHAGGQIFVTSHNASAIRAFSRENTFFVARKSHMEPSMLRSFADSPPPKGEDVATAFLEGDLNL